MKPHGPSEAERSADYRRERQRALGEGDRHAHIDDREFMCPICNVDTIVENARSCDIVDDVDFKCCEGCARMLEQMAHKLAEHGPRDVHIEVRDGPSGGDV